MDEDYLPTPAEIREECRRIQSEWSPTQRRHRSGGLDSGIDSIRYTEDTQEPSRADCLFA